MEVAKEVVSYRQIKTEIAGEMQTPDLLVNKVRVRAGAPLVTGIELRAGEFSWDAWRRNDLIRFNEFETEYQLPDDVKEMNKNVSRRLYPISG